jgi:hypothetical protein
VEDCGFVDFDVWVIIHHGRFGEFPIGDWVWFEGDDFFIMLGCDKGERTNPCPYVYERMALRQNVWVEDSVIVLSFPVIDLPEVGIDGVIDDLEGGIGSCNLHIWAYIVVGWI